MTLTIVWRCPECNDMVRKTHDFGDDAHPESTVVHGPVCSSQDHRARATLTGTAKDAKVMEPIYVERLVDHESDK